jgi:hypothetical protein
VGLIHTQKISEFNPKSPPERYVHFEFLSRVRALRLDAVIYPSNRSEEETREITRPHRWLHPDLERLISAPIYLAKSSSLLVLSRSTCAYIWITLIVSKVAPFLLGGQRIIDTMQSHSN